MVGYYGQKKTNNRDHVLNITWSNKKEWLQQLLFFAVFYVAIFFALTYLKKDFAPGAIPWADAFASCYRFYRYVADGKKKSGKLVLVDCDQHCVHTIIFCKTLCFYKCILCYLINFCILGIRQNGEKI